VLDQVDLDTKYDDKRAYEKDLKKWQLRALKMQRKAVEERVPICVVFEGWDASGKGGAIKRLTECIDPRGFRVVGVRAPTVEEKEHPYLWRFWHEAPRAGEIVIFDRSWYGRVLVERVEHLAPKPVWKRAYQEINNFERVLVDEGTVLVKHFLHIDKKTQLKRFKERQENPLKRWKITDEDWRNRRRWDDYEEAIEDMLSRTSTREAPWNVVGANWKWKARVDCLRETVQAFEQAV
jgi:polyphosphate kinase 2 (PPK2 family)